MNVIPQELYIQLDNTSKDNKNRFFLAFCDLMVHIGLFNRVTVNFLPVGHTHEDIDRKFSRVSVYLKYHTTATVADLHTALKTSQIGKTEPFVGRIEGMYNFSSALTDQKVIIPQVDGMLTFRKFVFERDSSREGSESKHYVNCMVARNMSDKRDDWTILSRKEGCYGVFLKRLPDVKMAPLLKTKVYNEADIDAFRKRIRLTETRMNAIESTEALRSEVDRIDKQRVAYPEWDFSRIYTLATKNILSDSEEEDSSGEDPEVFLVDGTRYEAGAMVTVNCGANSTPATPFWLGRIDQISRSTTGEIELLVWWYEVFGENKRPDPCYTRKYRPLRRSRDCQSVISHSSVLVYFQSLKSSNNGIPELVQRYTREALDNNPFGSDSDE